MHQSGQDLTLGKIGMQPVPDLRHRRQVAFELLAAGLGGTGQHAVQQLAERTELLRRSGPDQPGETGHRARQPAEPFGRVEEADQGLAPFGDVGLAQPVGEAAARQPPVDGEESAAALTASR